MMNRTEVVEENKASSFASLQLPRAIHKSQSVAKPSQTPLPTSMVKVQS